MLGPHTQTGQEENESSIQVHLILGVQDFQSFNKFLRCSQWNVSNSFYLVSVE